MRTTKSSRSMAAVSAGFVILLAACGSDAQSDTAAQDAAEVADIADAGDTVVVVEAEGASSFAVTNLDDMALLSDYVVAVLVEKETRLPPPEPSDASAFVGQSVQNLYSLTVEDVIWTPDQNGPAVGDNIEVLGSGRHVPADPDEEEFAFFPHLRTGDRFILSVSQYPEGLVSTTSETVFPIDENGQFVDWRLRGHDGEWTKPAVPRGLDLEGATTVDALRSLLAGKDPNLDARAEYPLIYDRATAQLQGLLDGS